MTKQDKKSINTSTRGLSSADIEMPEAPDNWELEDFEDILPRGAGK